MQIFSNRHREGFAMCFSVCLTRINSGTFFRLSLLLFSSSSYCKTYVLLDVLSNNSILVSMQIFKKYTHYCRIPCILFFAFLKIRVLTNCILCCRIRSFTSKSEGGWRASSWFFFCLCFCSRTHSSSGFFLGSTPLRTQ